MSADPDWLVCLVAAAGGGTLGDDMAASSVVDVLLWVSVFRRSGRRPHLHDGIYHTAVCMSCHHTDIVGK